MYPILFRIGNFEITSFGLMMFVSFIAAAWIFGKQLQRYGYPRDIAWDVLAWVAIGGILGAKFYYLALHWQDLVANPIRELLSRGGLVWYGGLIGGIVAFYFQVRAKKLPIALMFDGTAAALAIAYAVGRLGCFLVGDDYGVPTNSWVGIAFPEGSPPSTAANLRAVGADVPPGLPDDAVLRVHPTQLYEIGLALVMFAVLWRMGRAKLHQGQLFALYMMLYSVERFFIEFLRAKGDRIAFGLSTSQVASIILLTAGIALWTRQRRAPLVTFPALKDSQTAPTQRVARAR
ncbi:MAG: prolipoprotein diacylglyceryl transferase [Longimicrobiales bacterium]